MKMECIDFVKVSASGNDFVIIDNRNGQIQDLRPRISNFAKEVCQRKRSIGADGMLLLEESEAYDLKMRVFNPDGDEVQMCGNGARCIALWAKSKIKNQKSKIEIETKAGVLEAEVMDEDRVRLKMSDPKDYRADLELDIEGKFYDVFYINTGVPHVLSFVDDLDGVDVIRVGKAIRYHPKFQPQGTNADFVKVLNQENIKIRTYERGVEDETFSCGTGAVAAAVISAKVGKVKPPVDVLTWGGDRLDVYFDLEGELVKDVYLEGRAKVVYEGKMKVHMGKFWGQSPTM